MTAGLAFLGITWLAFARRRAWEHDTPRWTAPPPQPATAMTLGEFDARVRAFTTALERLVTDLEALGRGGAPPPLRLVRGGKP